MQRHTSNSLGPRRCLQWLRNIIGRGRRATSPSWQYIHNSEHSGLYRLPLELLLLISEHCSQSGKLALAHAGRSLYIMLGRGEKLSSTEEMRAFKAMMDKDDYYRKCQAERASPKQREHILCYPCRIVHPKSCFTEEQIREQAERRMCIGAMSSIPICKHHTFTFAELKELSGDFVCADCAHKARELVRNEYSFWQEEYQTRCVPSSKRICVDSCYPLLDTSREVSKDALHKALVALDVMICPHLRTGDFRVIEHFAKSRLFGEPAARFDSFRLGSCRPCWRRWSSVHFNLLTWPLSTQVVALRIRREIRWISVMPNGWQAGERSLFRGPLISDPWTDTSNDLLPD